MSLVRYAEKSYIKEAVLAVKIIVEDIAVIGKVDKVIRADLVGIE